MPCQVQANVGVQIGQNQGTVNLGSPAPASAAQVLGQMAQSSSSLNASQLEPLEESSNSLTDGVNDDSKMSKAQEKANRIVAEAIAKAHAQGKPIPTVGEGDQAQGDTKEDTENAAKGKKRVRVRKTPKKPKDSKEPKEKKEKKKKEPKEPKEPKKKAAPKPRPPRKKK